MMKLNGVRTSDPDGTAQGSALSRYAPSGPVIDLDSAAVDPAPGFLSSLAFHLAPYVLMI
jgi:hypothetical protein